MAAASRVQKKSEGPVTKGAGNAGTPNSPALGSQSKVVANGTSIYKPGTPANGHPSTSKANAPIPGHTNGLPHSASAYNLSSNVQPLGAIPASQVLTRSTSEPNTTAANVRAPVCLPPIFFLFVLFLSPAFVFAHEHIFTVSQRTSRSKKPVKNLTKEMSLKIAVLLEDISALGAGNQHSGKSMSLSLFSSSPLLPKLLGGDSLYVNINLLVQMMRWSITNSSIFPLLMSSQKLRLTLWLLLL